MVIRRVNVGFLLLAVFIPVAGLPAQVVLSNFATDTDGWQRYVGGDAATSVSWTATGGNAGGGGLMINDAASGADDYFEAPAKFLGNQSGYYGGTLGFDLLINHAADNIEAPNSDFPDNVILTGIIGGSPFSIAHKLSSTPVTTGFTSYSISLQNVSGWYIAGGLYSQAITSGQLQNVLGNLTDFRILGDWRNGAENNVLDNVRFTAVPEPATFAALGGMGALGFAAYRRRRPRLR